MDKYQFQRPGYGKILGYDHITFWVGNAKQSAAFFTSRFGFEYFMYRGLETGERDVVSHAVKSSDGIIFVFCSVYNNYSSQQMNEHLINHGDGVKDIAFTVQSSSAVYEYALKNGATPLRFPTKLEDKDGSVVISTVRTYGDTTHTFVERKKYRGTFLPGFLPHYNIEAMNKVFRPIRFERIDHIVGNQTDLKMEETAKFYEKCLGFHRLWSVDEKAISTDFSCLRSVVMADFDDSVKMLINEPAAGKRKSQVQQYVDYYHGAGVQHISLRTQSIIETVENMRVRGVQFLHIPDSYYDNLRKNLAENTIKISENIDYLQKNRILADFDDKGYILQIFTKPIEDRPTLFFEIVQRRNYEGFGVGNAKNLFVAMEQQQARRGNLTDNI